MAGHTAIVTGANHGIGAATAAALARRGCGVLCTFLRVDDPDDPGTPQARPMSYGRPGSPTLRTTSAGDGVKAVRIMMPCLNTATFREDP